MKHLERALDGQNQWWKYLVISVLAFVGANIIGAIPLVITIAVKTIQSTEPIIMNPNNPADLSVYGISQNFGLILIIIPFVVGLLVMLPLFKALHKRKVVEVLNGRNSLRWKRCFVGFGIWFVLMTVYLIASYYIDSESFVYQFDIKTFIPLLLISLLLIPFQTTFEEVLCRGYWAQGIAAATRNRWLVVLIPGIAFALLHSFNPEIKEFGFWAVMPQYMIFGVLFGLIATLDDGIELSMGVHAANNIFLSLFVTSKSSALQTPAVFSQTNIDPMRETILLSAFGIALVIILAIIYKWNFGVLNRKVEKE